MYNGARLIDSSIRLKERKNPDSRSFTIAALHQEFYITYLESDITSTKYGTEYEGSLKIDLSGFDVTSTLFLKITIEIILQLVNYRRGV